jgi:hypothetical protein
MRFKDAYKILKKLPDYDFLRNCFDWGDSWEFGFAPYFAAQGELVFGCADFIDKKTGKITGGTSFYGDPNRITENAIPVAVPRFAQEGWDYYDAKTDTFQLKPDAPYWAKQEFEEFYRSDEFERQPARLAYA